MVHSSQRSSRRVVMSGEQEQGVVTYAPSVEAFATGIKIGSNDQRYFLDRSSDHSHFHHRYNTRNVPCIISMLSRTIKDQKRL